MPNECENKHAGFTLLEVLIAVFIFAIVSFMMVTTLHNILGNQARVEQHSKSFAEIQLALLYLANDMEQIVNRPTYNGQGTLEPALVGKASEVTFTHGGLSNPLLQTRSTLQRTRYFLESGKLYREAWSMLDRSLHSQAIKRLLLSDISDLRFSYFDEKGQFQKQWPVPDDKKALPLPKAIQLSITLKKGGKLSQVYFISSQPPEQNNEKEKKPEEQQANDKKS